MTRTNNRWLAYIALLIILTGILIGSGLQALNRTEYANVWDGYYYLIQVQSLNNTGAMHSPEYSPVYLLLIALYAITGNYITSYKISAVMENCICPECPVTLDKDLMWGYYCTRGSAEEMMAQDE